MIYDRPTRERTMMSVAQVMADRSTCDRKHVGAVIVRDGRVLSSGYNGAPTGVPHCDHASDAEGCEVAVHAEANAIAFAAKHGVATDEAELFVTMQPCRACAQLIINAGISRVWFRDKYRLSDGRNLLHNVGIPCHQI